MTSTAMGRHDAVIFDMDGVLIDSEPLWQRAEVEVLGAAGVRLTTDDCARTTGLRIDEVVEVWRREQPWAEPATAVVAARIVDRVIEHVQTEGTLLPGAASAIELFADRRIPLGLASSSPRRLIDAVLDRFGLRARFHAVCSAERLPKGKPDPAVYLAAARQLGLAPARCVAIEDSIPGVQAAKAAGMTCIAVPAVAQRDDPGFGPADVVLDSLARLDAALWARL